jgi:hypothetical protein
LSDIHINGRKYNSYHYEKKMKIKNRCHSSIAIKGNAIGEEVEWVYGRIKKFLVMKLKINGDGAALGEHGDEFLVCQVSRYTVVSRDIDPHANNHYTGLHKVSALPAHRKLIYVAPELISKPVVFASCHNARNLDHHQDMNNFLLVLDCKC